MYSTIMKPKEDLNSFHLDKQFWKTHLQESDFEKKYILLSNNYFWNMIVIYNAYITYI